MIVAALLAVVAADDAFKDAGLKSRAYSESPDFDGVRFGCNIGAGLISAELNELTAAMTTARADENANKLDLHKWGRDGMGQLTPLWLLKYLPNMLACHVTIIHGLMGPSNTITCADASSHLAIGEAIRLLVRQLALAGLGHSDLHLGNMLLSNGKVYLLDAQAVHRRGVRMDRQPAPAVLLARVPSDRPGRVARRALSRSGA